MTDVQIIITETPLSLVELNEKVQVNHPECGGAVVFTGSVRQSNLSPRLTGMTLEHYPGMTEKALESIVNQAQQRWKLKKVVVVHRVGYLKISDPIVFVGVCGAHRAECFEAAQFIMDYLKVEATFWKKEHYGDKSHWVDAKETDDRAADRWKR